MSKEITWQVAFKSKDIAFGLEIFESESEAENRAFELQNEGKEGITLTKIIDTSPMQMWKLSAEGFT